MHLQRLRRIGSTDLPPQRTIAERFWEKVERTTEGCWPWQGTVHAGTGYGHFSLSHAKPVPAHRMSYELAIGSIPQGMTIDHLCRNRRCVNPAHLEATTQQTNLLRGKTLAAENAAKTHCPAGHPYDEVNTYPMPNGGRGCRTCRIEADRRYHAKLRQLKP